MSRPETPKQFLSLTGDRTMFEATLARVGDAERFASPIVVANAQHADLIDIQLRETPATIILEPNARNTAPAIALAALAADREAVLLVMPSDHVVTDPQAFLSAIAAARGMVDDNWLVTFGITPDGPETGYGYIKIGAQLQPGVARVARFVEKPGRADAEAMIADGDHVWNGGIFLFRAESYLAALAEHAPDMLAACEAAMAGAVRSGNRVVPDADAFAASPAVSVDYAVMERAERVAVVPVDMGWSDVGSWDALYTLGADADGHAHDGDVIAIDTRNCLVKSDGIRVTALGVEDLIIVASGDSVLVMPRGRSQEVRRIVDALTER